MSPASPGLNTLPGFTPWFTCSVQTLLIYSSRTLEENLLAVLVFHIDFSLRASRRLNFSEFCFQPFREAPFPCSLARLTLFICLFANKMCHFGTVISRTHFSGAFPTPALHHCLIGNMALCARAFTLLSRISSFRGWGALAVSRHTMESRRDQVRKFSRSATCLQRVCDSLCLRSYFRWCIIHSVAYSMCWRESFPPLVIRCQI